MRIKPCRSLSDIVNMRNTAQQGGLVVTIAHISLIGIILAIAIALGVVEIIELVYLNRSAKLYE